MGWCYYRVKLEFEGLQAAVEIHNLTLALEAHEFCEASHGVAKRRYKLCQFILLSINRIRRTVFDAIGFDATLNNLQLKTSTPLFAARL